MVDEAALEQWISERMPEGARFRLEVFPSGAVTVDLWFGNDFAVIQGSESEGEWGFDVNPNQDEAFVGFRNVAGSLDEALATVTGRLRGSA
ncbi:hypothetical protein [Nocardiopsis ganjiahuensis]|uniref:hypothetical protein n=1 Tax=Nocardiopsis ganjiahuensis TaxID=239984 RepID=UPI0003648C6C|nr:hypothetical protein [Nocardiopsis ganjiahuensis]